MSISVVQYQTSPQKLNVLQQSQNGNSREVIILRKPQPKEILITNPARKKGRNGEKMTNPPPVAVARRNARERNRVKQVNNGFATLRQHIPNSIAAAFESNNGRGGNKKLSKVETLRMAVEYIRSLEDMLAGDEGESNVSSGSVATSYISSTPSSPALTTTANMSYNYPITSQSEDDELSTSPHMRNYQIFYEDNENLEPLSDDLLITSDLELGNQDLSLLNSMHTTGSLSPEMYSDDSLSPRQVYIYPPEVKLRLTPEIKSEPPVLSLPADTDLPVDSKENMIEVMAWWEQQQSRS